MTFNEWWQLQNDKRIYNYPMLASRAAWDAARTETLKEAAQAIVGLADQKAKP